LSIDRFFKGELDMKKVDDDKVFWARDNETVMIPTKREEDAGWDIYANFEEDMWVIQPHTTVMIPTNLRSAFSPKWVAILKERGSTGTKGIAQRCGVIDSGFRNAWMIPITNTTDKPIVILKKGVDVEGLSEVVIYPYEKAIAQAIFVEVPKLQSEEISVEELLNIKSERGEGMLGSSKK
jgi:dUTP pyrophosphatase